MLIPQELQLSRFRWGLPAFAYITSKASQIGRGGGRTAEKSKT